MSKVANYDPQMQAGYAPQMQPGYAPQTQPGYARQMQPGYASQMQPGYAPQMGMGPPMLVPNQPQLPVVWMRKPAPIPNYAPGLEFLFNLDKIIVQQEIASTMFTGFGNKNRYMIRNSASEQIFIAAENSNVDMTVDNRRAFVFQLYDESNQEVIRISRAAVPLVCCPGCCGSDNQRIIDMKIEAPPGQIVGYIRKETGKFLENLKLSVLDVQEQVVFNIISPGIFDPRTNVQFRLQTNEANGSRDIGFIMKYFSGDFQEYYTKADNYTLHVPPDLDLNMKACLLGGVILIDFIFFESTPAAYRQHHHHHH